MGLEGVDGGTRTHDCWDHNPGLYQLSYAHLYLDLPKKYKGLLRVKIQGKSIVLLKRGFLFFVSYQLLLLGKIACGQSPGAIAWRQSLAGNFALKSSPSANNSTKPTAKKADIEGAKELKCPLGSGRN